MADSSETTTVITAIGTIIVAIVLGALPLLPAPWADWLHGALALGIVVLGVWLAKVFIGKRDTEATRRSIELHAQEKAQRLEQKRHFEERARALAKELEEERERSVAAADTHRLGVKVVADLVDAGQRKLEQARKQLDDAQKVIVAVETALAKDKTPSGLLAYALAGETHEDLERMIKDARDIVYQYTRVQRAADSLAAFAGISLTGMFPPEGAKVNKLPGPLSFGKIPPASHDTE